MKLLFINLSLLFSLLVHINYNVINAQSSKSKAQTIVIVHGAWGGSWAFKKVDSILSTHQHKAYRPCLTGQGERFHLSSSQISLTTHINDIVNTILFEDLHNVVLIGHSYGGMVITGVADRIPERINKLIYLDAMVPRDGESAISRIDEKRATWIKSMVKNGFMVPNWIDTTQCPRDVPQSYKTFTQPIVLKNIKREKIPAAYILTYEQVPEKDDFYTESVRAKENGWKVYYLTADHNPQFTMPEKLGKKLTEVINDMENRLTKEIFVKSK